MQGFPKCCSEQWESSPAVVVVMINIIVFDQDQLVSDRVKSVGSSSESVDVVRRRSWRSSYASDKVP